MDSLNPAPRRRARRRIALLAGAIASLVLFPARANDLEIRSGANDTTVEPGRLVTRNVVVVNRGPRSIEASEELLLPKGWLPIQTADPVFTLDPGTTQIRILALSIPASAASGRPKLVYRLRDRTDHSVLIEFEIPIEVKPVGRVELTWSDLPGSVLAGEPISITASLMNRGNCPVEVHLRPTSHPSTPATLERRVTLQAGQSEEVSFEVATDENLTRQSLYLIQVKADYQWGTSETSPFPSRSWTVEVLPQKPVPFDPYVRLPVQLTTTAAWERGRQPGVQAELSGRGRLNDAGDQRVDFRLVGPSGGSEASSLRRQDEYGVSLLTTHWNVDFGDRSFMATPLLKSTGNDRGVGFDWHRNGLSAGGFAVQSRNDPNEGRSASAYLGWRLRPDAGLRYQTLWVDAGDQPSRLLHSLSGDWTWTNRVQLTLEGALDPTGSLDDATAWRADASGWLGQRGGWHASHTHAGTAFGGEITGATTTSAGGYHEITDALRVAGEWRTYQSTDPGGESDGPRASRDTQWRVGPRYRWENRTTASLDLRSQVREEAQGTALTRLEERSLAASVGRDFDRSSFELTEEVGRRSENPLSSEAATFLRTSALALWRATERQTYSASVQMEHAGTPESSEPKVQGTLSGTWRLGASAQASLSVTHQPETGKADARTTVQAQGEWRLRNRHEVNARVRIAEGGPNTHETAVSLSYRIPLDVPVARRRGFGTLQGTVRAGEPDSSNSLARVVVRLNTGETAVTDRQGRFTFSGLKPGDYTASVDSRSLGFGRISADWIPQRVSVAKDSVTTMELIVVSAAALTVRLTVFEETPVLPGTEPSQPAPQRYRPTGPLAGEVVELSDGHQTLRRVTGADGQAAFTPLRPGPWHLRVYDSALPPQHAVEQPERDLELHAGARLEEGVRILPKKRRIRIIDQGT